ncbi:hypothetical protein [Cellulomonas sp. C5510]|uniref:hypothetical protein n=1 Tax=Cellulomonas sp. C5510 TaxID=2871170 RepID=UPI001C93CC5C|nr:hypothetical protein [Cellulomonas sp. C5510]QZN84253.1 hypothetical protein K5O09_10130 [Cellulomonas sp. C5510]
MGAKRGTWIAGAAFIGVVALVGTWFLGVSPVLDESARLTAESETTRAQNVQLEAKLHQLSADSAKLPELKAELAQLQVGIPTTAQVDDFLRWVDEIQTARQIPTVNVEVADPMSVVDNRGALTPEPAPTDASSASPSPEPSASPDDTSGGENADKSTAETPTAAVPGPDGFVAVPVTITVLGNFVSSLGFISDLQSADGRLFLVTDLEGFGQDDAEAADGRPATVRGDVELTITGNLYVLIDPAGLTAPEQDGSLPPLDPGKPALGADA